ncbi:conserved protein of unknown function [Petrocella atlantisensis]|uniref:Activator of Hsp90 ATPase homologue 1/2-like C-terminal domain-containing protein n=1 Tax=Petrocella atlantisensis TaxID=2173034 RepID=A0A3P7P0V8_9FIRM|nr:SRPBCC domain-containing protein [Petrocella atlantisensis]VDN47100.1 conserved protein of unknown function [Petrocella atlantisensis]
MKKIKKSVDIKTSPEVIWGAIINPSKYQLWTSVFQEGSYFEGGWQKGDHIKFLMADEQGHTMGLYSEIAESDHLKYISIKHLGLVKDDSVDYTSEEARKWTPSFENYYLEKINDDHTRFTIEVDVDDEEFTDMSDVWDLGLVKLKEVCEKNSGAFTEITFEALIEAPLHQVWEYWTSPEHIIKWNFASEDWHCPEAVNHLFKGGRFVYTMAAKDGSMSFGFSGTYTDLVEDSYIINQLDDGRMMKVLFQKVGEAQTKVIETFDAEDINTIDLQKEGWQSILNNFKKVVEV